LTSELGAYFFEGSVTSSDAGPLPVTSAGTFGPDRFNAGNSAFVIGADSDQVPFSTSAFTSARSFSIWFSPDSTQPHNNVNNGPRLISNENGTAFTGVVNASFALVGDGGMVISAQIVDNASAFSTARSPPILANGWHHVVMTIGTSTVNLYVDGELAGSATSGGFTGSSNSFTLGQAAMSTGYSMRGSLDDFRVYSRELTPTEARALYDERGWVSCGARPINFAFVTSNSYRGNFGGLVQADAICQEHANDAGMKGTYVAWLSSDAGWAAPRLGYSRGWYRPDGKPAIDSLAALTQRNEMFYPVAVNEKGATTTAPPWTGTDSSGRARFQTCDGWSSMSATITGTVGRVDATGTMWTLNNDFGCDQPRPLYCFGISAHAPARPTAPGARRAFLSQPFIPASTGIVAADNQCNSEAIAAGVGNNYRALLATDAGSAASRFNLAGPPWARLDGALLAPTAAAMMNFANLDTSLNLRADGVYSQGQGVWIGSTDLNSPGNLNCRNWTMADATQMGAIGIEIYVFANRYANASVACSDMFKHLYCLEQ
jgi:hypothetical protein